MSRRCELTGKAVQSGNKVSHSNRKTRTRFLPNLVQVTLTSDLLERKVRLRVTAAALRSVEHRGGLDDFLVKAHESELSEDAVKLKREIAKKRAETKAEPDRAGPSSRRASWRSRACSFTASSESSDSWALTRKSSRPPRCSTERNAAAVTRRARPCAQANPRSA